MGGNLIQRQPSLKRVPRPPDARLLPVTVTPDDALKMLEFVVLAIEARRPDWLENINFRLEVGEPALWALPFDDEGPGLGQG
jgi:hypothetical protein